MMGLPPAVLGRNERARPVTLSSMPEPEVLRENALRAKLADTIATRIAAAEHADALDALLSDALFEDEEDAEFLALGGLMWTAERADSVGAFDPFVASVLLGSLASAAISADEEPIGGPAGLQELLYGSHLPRPIQHAIHEGLIAHLAVLTLLLRSHDVAADVRDELHRRALEGTRAYLPFLYGAALSAGVAVPNGLSHRLDQLGVVPMNVKDVHAQSANERSAVEEYLRRSAR
jgi:hypothetical protein